MATAQSSGAVDVRSGAHVDLVNTGWLSVDTFEMHVHLSVSDVEAGLRDVEQRISGGQPLFDEAADGADIARMVDAWRLMPRVAGQSREIGTRAYAAWLLARQVDGPPELLAAREHYLPLGGRLERDDPLAPSFRLYEPRTSAEEAPSKPLKHVADALQEHPAVVLLGPSGSGKSTVLQRMALDAAKAIIRDEGQRVPLLLTLADDQQRRITSPLQFVRQAWQSRLPGDFREMLSAGRVLLLLDGYNEMARLDNDAARNQRAQSWRRFLAEHFGERSCASRVVVASRDRADYSAPLGLPRVVIDPLGDRQVHAYLQAFGLGPDEKAAFLAEIDRLGAQEMLKRPLDLGILAASFDPDTGTLPANRGRLFHSHALRLLAAEETKGHPDWIRLPLLAAGMAELCYQLQVWGESTIIARQRLVAIAPDRATAEGADAEDDLDCEALIAIMERAGLLLPDDRSSQPEARRFSHQLFQETLAAHEMLSRYRAGDDLSSLWRAPRYHAEMPAPNVGEWDPRPEPPDNGWQQTTILAAGLIDVPKDFIADVAKVNPALAARCVLEGGIDRSEVGVKALRHALLEDLQAPALHRRARIQAGRLLGDLGDLRFPVLELGGVRVILPPLVTVPGGEARLGRHRWLSLDRGRYSDEHPPCRVDIEPFLLGRYPVTNAEYACFVAAGGYDDESLWVPPGAWTWRMGQERTNETLEDFLRAIRWRAENPDGIERDLRAGRITEGSARQQQWLVSMSEDERREALEQWPAFQSGRRDSPLFDDDPTTDGPNQPRVGVSWYEADAYCRWLGRCLAQLDAQRVHELWQPDGWTSLAPQSSLDCRLPTEAEWEWAAGGPKHDRYPWGARWNADRGNALDGRVLRTTSVGAYPAGRANCGAEDMSGNIWEWTRSLYRPYPYEANDGREKLDAEGPRVVRGGSWDGDPRGARAAGRDGDRPDGRVDDIGFRLVVIAAPVS